MIAAGTRYITHPSRTDWIRLWNIGDIHYGNKACALKEVRRDVDEIRRDPYSFWVGMGDMAEYIGFTDPRFDPSVIPPDMSVRNMASLGKVLTEAIRDIFAPIKHKCLGMLFGNHEFKYEKKAAQQSMLVDWHAWLCRELEVPNMGYCALTDICFVRRGKGHPKLVASSPTGTSSRFRLFAHHGAGGAITPAGKLNTLKKAMDNFDADIYFLAHVHDQQALRDVRITANDRCDRLTERVRLGIITGAYLKTYAQNVITYGEERMYPPTTLGASHVKIKPETREMVGQV